MKASRLPRPVTPAGSARLLPAFSSSELAKKRLRHLSGSSSSSCVAAPAVKAQRAEVTPPATRPASPLEGYAVADASLQFPAPHPQRPRQKRDKPRAGLVMNDVEGAAALPSSPQPPTSAVTAPDPAALPQPPRRNRDEPADTDNEGFTLVTKKKKGKKTPPADVPSAADAATDISAAPPTASAPRPGLAPRTSRPAVGVARQQPLPCKYPAFRVPAQEGFDTSYDAVAALEDVHPHLCMKNVIGRDGSSVLLPLDDATFATLDAAASTPAGPVTLIKLQTTTQLTKGVVMGYPLRMPLALLHRHPNVEEATRCVSSRSKQETQQVIVAVRGPLPAQLDLGNWGVFYTRPYSPEPLRCYNCQRFGHHRATCSRSPVCAICSAGHHTQQCLDKFKSHQEVTHKCPNCGKGHHAWNLGCPARLQRVRAGRQRQVEWVREKQRTAPTPAPPGTFVWGDKKNTAPSTAVTSEDFPPLTTAPSPPQSTPTPPSAPQPSIPSGSVIMSAETLREFARQVTLALSDFVLRTAGVTGDITSIQEKLLHNADVLVQNVITDLQANQQ